MATSTYEELRKRAGDLAEEQRMRLFLYLADMVLPSVGGLAGLVRLLGHSLPQTRVLVPTQSLHHVEESTQSAAARPPEEERHAALALAGAWSDLDWAAAEQELDRIRHESEPTPPYSE